MALTAKNLIIALFIITLVSGSIGAYVYFSYVGPVEKLSETGALKLGEVLDRVSYIEYEVNYNGTKTLFKVNNDPAGRSGVVEAYASNGTLLYKLEYRYSDELLEEAYRVYPNGTRSEENPQAYEPFFKTSIYLRLAGQEAEAGAAAGVGPAYIIYYLTDELDIDWNALTSPRGGQPSQLVDIGVIPGDVEAPWGTTRGVTLNLVPLNPLFSPTVWGMPEYTIDLVNLDGLVISPYYKATLTLQAGEYVVEVKLLDIKLAG